MKLLHIHIAFGLVSALFLVPFLFPDNVDFVGIRYKNLRIWNQADIILNVKIGLWQLILGANRNGITCHRAFEIQCGWGGLPCWSFWGLRLAVVAAIMLIAAAVLVGCRNVLSKWVSRCGVFAILFALMIIIFVGFLTMAIINRIGDTDEFLEFVCWSIGQGDSDCLKTILVNCLAFQSGYSPGEERPQGLSISITKNINFLLMSQMLYLFLSILGITIWCCFLRFVNSVANSKEDDLRLSSSKKYEHLILKSRKDDYGSSRQEGLIRDKTVIHRKPRSQMNEVKQSKLFLPGPNPHVKFLS